MMKNKDTANTVAALVAKALELAGTTAHTAGQFTEAINGATGRKISRAAILSALEDEVACGRVDVVWGFHKRAGSFRKGRSFRLSVIADPADRCRAYQEELFGSF